MSTISISDLKPSGLDLFLDSENYLDEISESEFTNVVGGVTPVTIEIITKAALAASSYRCRQNLMMTTIV
jgi:hypothetical protein